MPTEPAEHHMDLLNPNPDPPRTHQIQTHEEKKEIIQRTTSGPYSPRVSLRHPSWSAQLHSRPQARDTHAQAIYRLLALRSGQYTSAPRSWFVGRAYRLRSAGETGQCSSVVLTWLGDLWCTTYVSAGASGMFSGRRWEPDGVGGFCLVSPRRKGLGWVCGL
jgi:hypothetical protein